MENKKRDLLDATPAHQDMVDYLASLGYYPEKISRQNYWYLSPLREESAPSFKVDKNLNLWYDHGLGQGGTLIDFGVLYHQCTIREFMTRLNRIAISKLEAPGPSAKPSSPLKIVAIQPLSSITLTRYLHHRRIRLPIAEKYCKEITFAVNQKTYDGIGFRNDRDGFEIRNNWFKGSASPKAVTTIKNRACHLSVFEGFFDFLSLLSIVEFARAEMDFLILNSLAFFEKSRDFMESYDIIFLYLDHDPAGQNCTSTALSSSPKYQDKSGLYTGYKDLNDWVMHIGSAS